MCIIIDWDDVIVIIVNIYNSSNNADTVPLFITLDYDKKTNTRREVAVIKIKYYVCVF